LVGALLPGPAAGQSGSTASRSDTLHAARIGEGAEPFRLDGLLSEEFWSRARPIGGFVQREPLEGVPANEDTEVRVAYDDANLYVGILARDSRPDEVVARLRQRDRILSGGGFGFNFTSDDAVAFLIDPFHDSRNGVVFATNPEGALFDALISDEGNEINVDWQGVWEVAATRVPEGWSAEFAIPWRSLRYPVGDPDHTWGFNATRIVQRTQEETLWRAWDREGGGFDRVSQAGVLAGLDQAPNPGITIETKPFLLGGRNRDRNDAGTLEGSNELDFGIDLKSEIVRGLVLDLTYNTDFAQVEVDDQQVNLTRFNLFFPEKREFFLENSGVFEFGRRGFFEPPPYLMFFSRRIGIGDDGEVPIIGGGRLTGRVGGQTVGLLSVVTDDVPGTPGEIFNVARLKRDVGQNNYVGFKVTDRRGVDGPAAEPASTALGADARFFPHPTLELSGFAARSFTEGAGGDGWVYQGGANWTTDRWGAFGQFFSVAPDAVASSGFITRTDIQRSQLSIRRRFRPDFLDLRRVDLRVAGEYQTTTTGRFQDSEWGPNLSFNWNSGDDLSFSYTVADTQVDDPFTLVDRVDVPAGRYSADGWNVRASTTSARPWVLRGNVRRSDYFGGTLTAYGGGFVLAPTPALRFDVGVNRNEVDLPGGDFVADIWSLRATWAISPLMTTNALIQYNSLADDILTNIRFNFIHRPGSDLFLVLTDERGVDGDLWALADQGLVAKLTYLVRF
jgi:hypothetical protein